MRDVFFICADIPDKRDHSFIYHMAAAVLITMLLCFIVSFYKLTTGGGENA